MKTYVEWKAEEDSVLDRTKFEKEYNFLSNAK